MRPNQLEDKMTKYEPRSFWIVTVAVIGVVILTIAFLSWFAYFGHEVLEPIHDEEPHALIIQSQRQIITERA